MRANLNAAHSDRQVAQQEVLQLEVGHAIQLQPVQDLLEEKELYKHELLAGSSSAWRDSLTRFWRATNDFDG